MNAGPRRPLEFVPLLLALALAVIAVTVAVQTGSSERPIDVDFQKLEPAGAPRKAQAVRLAVAPVWSPERTVDDYQALADYLAARIGRSVRLVQRKTYGEVNELLRHGSVDAAIICTGAYLDCQRSQIPLEVIALPVCRDGPVYYSLLIVRAQSDIRSLDQLQGRTFAFTDPLSLSGHYFPLHLLIERGLDHRAHFLRTIFTYGHDASIRAVLDGTVDAAAVDSLVYDFEARCNPAIETRLRIVHRSPPLGISPVVVPRSVDAGLREALRRALLEMHQTPAGRRILDNLAAARFDAPPQGVYDRAAEIYSRVRDHLEGKR